MKKYFSILMLAAGVIGFSACESDETEGLTYVENYPVITLEGEDVISLALGDVYEDGYSCTFEGADYTSNVEVFITDMLGEEAEAIDTSSPNIYTITYAAVSPKGYAWSKSRTIYVFDPDNETNISGVYVSDYDKCNYGGAGNWKTYNEMIADRGFAGNVAKIKVEMVVPGIYNISDFFGGWYSYVRGYAESYKDSYDMKGIFLLDSDNTMSLVSSKVAGWGDGLDYIEDGQYDPTTATLYWEFSYAGQVFGQVSMSCTDLLPKVRCPFCDKADCGCEDNDEVDLETWKKTNHDEALFDVVDADHSGTISKKEYYDYLASVKG